MSAVYCGFSSPKYHSIPLKMDGFLYRCTLVFYSTFRVTVLGVKNLFIGTSGEAQFVPDIDQLLIKHGYPVEIHEVTTEDGYQITLFRVPHGKNGTEVNQKPILMMHGLFGSPFNFVFTEYYNRSMTGYFADRGYDVWLGNTRGGTYARKHIKLDPKKTKFWKFSWHEIGIYDLPAMVDYILDKTSKKSLYYIGHSQGGTIFYVLASLRPEYQKKFTQVSLLAPGGFMKHFKNSLLVPLAKRHRMLTRVAENAKLYELPPPWMNLAKLLLNTCVGTLMQPFCEASISVMNGGDSGQFNLQLFPMLVNTIPTVSTMQALHYAQNIDSEKFREWDYGTKKNMKIYGEPEPPEYPVHKIEVPIAIYYSQADNMAFQEDQEAMGKALKNCTRMYLMPNPKWSHIDFIVAESSDQELHEPLLQYMDSFENP